MEVPTMLKAFFIGFLCCFLTLSPSSASEVASEFCSIFHNESVSLNLGGIFKNLQGKSLEEVMGKQKGPVNAVACKKFKGLKIGMSELFEATLSLSSDGENIVLQQTAYLTVVGSVDWLTEDKQPVEVLIRAQATSFASLKVHQDEEDDSIQFQMTQCKIADSEITVTADPPTTNIKKITDITNNKMIREKVLSKMVCPRFQEMVDNLSSALRYTSDYVGEEALGDNPVETVSSLLEECLVEPMDLIQDLEYEEDFEQKEDSDPEEISESEDYNVGTYDE